MSEKRKKNYFHKNSGKKFKNYTLQPGLKGFLCSCNSNEKDCVKEAYNILTKYHDLMNVKTKEPTASYDEENEIEDELEGELSKLKDKSSEKNSSKTFCQVESGAKNIIFIKSTVENPVDVVQKIVQDIYETQIQQTRYLIRLIPVEVTCKAYISDIKTAVKPLIDKYFAGAPKVFSIVYNHRNNNTLVKDEVIKEVAELVTLTRSDHSVNLKNADVSIIVEVIRSIALLAIVPNFLKYKKFNLHVGNTGCSSNKSDDS